MSLKQAIERLNVQVTKEWTVFQHQHGADWDSLDEAGRSACFTLIERQAARDAKVIAQHGYRLAEGGRLVSIPALRA